MPSWKILHFLDSISDDLEQSESHFQVYSISFRCLYSADKCRILHVDFPNSTYLHTKYT